MRAKFFGIAVSLSSVAFLAFPAVANALSDLVINVDCAGGDKIARALSRLNVLDRRMVIVISGTCTENVTIERDDVVLRSGGSGGGVSAADATSPTILINGARRVALENIAVNGGHDGVRITAGAAATIRGGSIRNAGFYGVRVNNNSSAVIDGSTIEGHGQYGVTAVGSTVTVTNSSIRGNGFSGVVSVSGGALVLGQVDDAGNVCCGNTIEDNRLDGVTASRGATVRMYGNVVQGNGVATGRYGVLVGEESLVWMEGGNQLRGNGSPTGGGGALVRASSLRTGFGDQPVIPQTNEISGNTNGIVAISANLQLQGGLTVTGNRFTGVSLDQGTRLRTDGTSITGNVGHGMTLSQTSGVAFIGGANNVSGNGGFGVICFDVGSHYAGNTAGVTGNTQGQVNCTPF
jgi:Right handed beta helix region